MERARVLFSYSAENDDELNIEEGEVITILDKELEDSGWWKGEINGKVGVFPDNFVELLPPEEPQHVSNILSGMKYVIGIGAGCQNLEKLPPVTVEAIFVIYHKSTLLEKEFSYFISII